MKQTNKNGYSLEESGYIKMEFKPYKRFGGGITSAKLTTTGKTLLNKMVRYNE